MTHPESKLFCSLDHMPGSDREQQRSQTLLKLGLLEPESIPVFEEATQTAAHFLDAPICILGFMNGDRQWFKSAVGLSRIGLMNDLASFRQLPRDESFCTHVVDSQQVLVIRDAASHPTLAAGLLVQRYGIRAYLGVPLLTSEGYCIGTLAIMELKPRDFNQKEIEFLEMTARWSISEFERNYLIKQAAHQQEQIQVPPESNASRPVSSYDSASSVKVDLITQMTQELRTPLTSILGMASVLNREIYGPLTRKQKEYMDIVHNSGQYLLSLVNEILELGALDDINRHLSLSSVDIEMLCQQSLSTLEQAAHRKEQQIRLTIEPGHRIWLLDKDKVRQMLYHLVFSVIQSSSTDSVIRTHVSRKQDHLNINVWTSHPWLGDGLPQAELASNQLLSSTKALSLKEVELHPAHKGSESDRLREHQINSSSLVAPERVESADEFKPSPSRQSLGLMLSRLLAEAHGGQVTIQGSSETGYRYVISLPQLTEAEN